MLFIKFARGSNSPITKKNENNGEKQAKVTTTVKSNSKKQNKCIGIVKTRVVQLLCFMFRRQLKWKRCKRACLIYWRAHITYRTHAVSGSDTTSKHNKKRTNNNHNNRCVYKAIRIYSWTQFNGIYHLFVRSTVFHEAIFALSRKYNEFKCERLQCALLCALLWIGRKKKKNNHLFRPFCHFRLS